MEQTNSTSTSTLVSVYLWSPVRPHKALRLTSKHIQMSFCVFLSLKEADKKPTKEHPYPEKWLGYEAPLKKPHQVLVWQSGTSNNQLNFFKIRNSEYISDFTELTESRGQRACKCSSLVFFLFVRRCENMLITSGKTPHY